MCRDPRRPMETCDARAEVAARRLLLRWRLRRGLEAARAVLLRARRPGPGGPGPGLVRAFAVPSQT